MAIHAIHHVEGVLGGVVLEVGLAKFRDLAVGVRDADPRDVLAFLVGREVLDLVGDVHVPVDASGRAVRRVAAANLEQMLRTDAWDQLPAQLASLFGHFSDITINKFTRNADSWEGAYDKLMRERVK